MARPPDKTARAELLLAASEEFAAHGVEGTTIQAITVRAGRSKGAFYLHFDSKDTAFRALVESVFDGLASFLGDVVPTPKLGWGLAEVRAHWLATDVRAFEYVWRHRDVFRLVLSGGMCERFAFLTDAFALAASESIARWLRYGVAQGFYRADLDVEIASMMIGGAYDGLARELVGRKRKPRLTQWLAQFQGVFVGGLGAQVRPRRQDANGATTTPVPRVARRNRGVASRR
ncbi:MAG: TetR/AcrR family transcriptional regulator [Myxococcales bacterium]|nr:TetR/AcrR family transcriptional regulator [Myxococcales bacterium]